MNAPEPVGLATLSTLTAAFSLLALLAPHPANLMFQVLALVCALSILARSLGHDPDKP